MQRARRRVCRLSSVSCFKTRRWSEDSRFPYLLPCPSSPFLLPGAFFCSSSVHSCKEFSCSLLQKLGNPLITFCLNSCSKSSIVFSVKLRYLLKNLSRWLVAHEDKQLSRVLDRLPVKGKEKPKNTSALPSDKLTTKVGNPSFQLWQSRFGKVARPPSDLLNYSRKQK